MGFRPGDEKIMQAPLDWIGFHYYSRRLISAARPQRVRAEAAALRTEIEDRAPAGNDLYTQFLAEMPTEGPLTEAGLEILPRGIYDLVTQISREYNFPTIEITESGCGYLDGPYDREGRACPTRAALISSARSSPSWRAPSRTAPGSVPSTPGACSTTSSGPMGTPSGMDSPTSTSATRNAP